jgi:ketosteroid isomerase-like protein
MKRLSLFVLIGVVVASGSAWAADLKAERDALMKRDAEWSAVASGGKDLEKILSFWSDDAVVIPSGQPIAEGKAAIRAFVAGALQVPGFKIQWTSEPPTLSPDGKLGYIRSKTAVTVNGPDGKAMTSESRSVTVWRKDADGQWRCVLDTWNEETAAAAAH